MLPDQLVLDLPHQIDQFADFALVPLEVIIEVLLALLFLRPQISLTRILSFLFRYNLLNFIV